MLKSFEYTSSSVINFFAPDRSGGAAPASGQSDVRGSREPEEGRSRDEVGTVSGQNEVTPDGRKKDSVELSRDAEEIRKLQIRDREVRAHEAAHASVGGAYAGAPSYTTKRGPDGKTYVTDGEVGIDVSPIKGDPEATLQKAEQVRAAALAPSQPSAQDMKVAQKAQAMAAKARMEISNEVSSTLESSKDGADHSDTDETGSELSGSDYLPPVPSEGVSGIARLSVYS